MEGNGCSSSETSKPRRSLRLRLIQGDNVNKKELTRFFNSIQKERRGGPLELTDNAKQLILAFMYNPSNPKFGSKEWLPALVNFMNKAEIHEYPIMAKDVNYWLKTSKHVFKVEQYNRPNFNPPQQSLSNNSEVFYTAPIRPESDDGLEDHQQLDQEDNKNGNEDFPVDHQNCDTIRLSCGNQNPCKDLVLIERQKVDAQLALLNRIQSQANSLLNMIQEVHRTGVDLGTEWNADASYSFARLLAKAVHGKVGLGED